MKFYDCATAPSPRRVRIFLAEKDIAVPTVQVNPEGCTHLNRWFAAVSARPSAKA